MNFNRECFELFLKPLSRFDPRRREGDALRAIGIAGEGAEFLEFSDGAFGIQRRTHAENHGGACRKFNSDDGQGGRGVQGSGCVAGKAVAWRRDLT